MQTILIGVSSGIAAFKAIDVVKELRSLGYIVQVLMTDSAKKMVSPKEFERASGNPVRSELFSRGFDYKKVLKERKVEHIQLADHASVFAILPATANIVANLAQGIAYDLVTTTALATRAPLLVFPSMNVNMWQNQVTQENIERLKKRGAIVYDPACGDLACGYTGKGRLPDPPLIAHEIAKVALHRNDLLGKRVIVTAGGTQEPIDDIRVITNQSSGKMGIAIAEECAKRGAHVTLIRGRTEVEPSVLVKDVHIGSSRDMYLALKKEVKNVDYIFHAAAVSDYTLSKQLGKLDSGRDISLHLRPAPKIIDQLKKWNRNATLIGFKAEYGMTEHQLSASGDRLLNRARCDLVVANDISKSPFGGALNKVLFIRKAGFASLPVMSKTEIAEHIVSNIVGGKAFAPANGSAIFQVYGKRGSPQRGSLGVGFTLDQGATVTARHAEKTEIFVNGKIWKFPTVFDVISRLTFFPLEITITSALPFGCGFGMSGASAFATALAVNQLLNLGKRREELALIAHQSEVANGTGLGDVAGQYTGGFMMRKKKGKVLDVERIPLCPLDIYFKAYGPIETKKVITSDEKLKKINRAGAVALSKISKKSTLHEIMGLSKRFAVDSGLLLDPKVKTTIEYIEKKGGRASMVMLGNAVFSTIPFPGCTKARIVEMGAHAL